MISEACIAPTYYIDVIVNVAFEGVALFTQI